MSADGRGDGPGGDLQQRLAAAEAALGRSPADARPGLEAVLADSRHCDPLIAARAAYLLARVAVVEARPLDALELIDSARDLFVGADAQVDAARTDLGKINVLNELGRHREAVDVGLALIDRFSPVDDHDDELIHWMVAGAAENTGASNGWLGHHGAALALYDQAASVYRRLGEPVDLARVSANRGIELLELGRHGDARGLLADAAATFDEQGDDLAVARCLAYEAKAHAMAGSYNRAVEALDAADRRLVGPDQTQDHLRVSLVWAEVYAVLNLTDEALARCEELIPIFERNGMARDAGLAQLVRATVLEGLQSTEAAIAACTDAEHSFAAAELPTMTARCQLLRSHLSEAGAAAALAAAAYARLSATGHASEAAEAALRCAELSISEGSAAIEALEGEKAPPILRDRASSGSGFSGLDYLEAAAGLIEEHDLDALTWRVDFIRGRWAEEAGEESLATSSYSRALTALRGLRANIGLDPIRVPFMGRKRHVQEALVFLLLRLGDIEGAAAVTEAERAGSLVEAMTDRATTSPRAAAAVDRRPTGVELTYQTLGEDIVCFVRRAGATEPALVRAKMALPEAEALIRKLDAQWRRFEDPRLASHYETLRRSTERILQDLYLGLFEQAEIHLEPEDSVLVAPAGVLANVPFHALHNGLSYLIERYEFSVTPSMTAASLAAAPPGGRTLVVGVADELAPDITEEAEQVAELTGGTLLRNGSATIAAVREGAEASEVIHLAAHGRFRHDNPWFSAIRLADGWVSALDIQEWDLGGALVVLAACRSGQQAGAGGGDELLGIPRALVAAGAAAVVVNLWPVDDRQSVGLMSGFHQSLREAPPPTALRRAQLAAMNRASHPYHWAPAVLYGSRPAEPTPRRDPRKAVS